MKAGPEIVIGEDALQPFVYRTSGEALLVCGFEQREADPSHPFPGVARAFSSHDGGHSWERLPLSGQEGRRPVVQTVGLERKDGSFLTLELYALREARDESFTAYGWASDDEFRSLEPLEVSVSVPRAVGSHNDGGVPLDAVLLHRDALRLPDDTLLMAAYGWHEEDQTPSAYEPTMMRSRALLLRSTDEGQTWSDAGTIAADSSVGQEGFTEPALARVRGGKHAGRLVCVMRTGSKACNLYQTHSEDDGASWAVPRPLAAVGVDPCLLALSEGRLALSYGTRLHDASGAVAEDVNVSPTNKIRISNDGGNSWSAPLELPPVSPSTGVGTTTNYTALTELSPGKLLMTYDIGTFWEDLHFLAARQIDLQV